MPSGAAACQRNQQPLPTIGVLIAAMYAVGMSESASKSFPMIAHCSSTLEPSALAKII